jgi:hypothetical protein
VPYYVLGFTADMVVGGWQDSRFGFECRQAWEAAGRPAGFNILMAPGEGEHVTHWFLDEPTVAILDQAGVAWRSFLVAERDSVPPGAVPVVELR